MVVFKLSMPNVGSWNNKWTGEGRCYARIRTDKQVPKDVIGQSFLYNFGDGWTACVEVEKVTNNVAKAIMKKSVGFSGYDWMIDSIIKYKEIFPPSRQ